MKKKELCRRCGEPATSRFPQPWGHDYFCQSCRKVEETWEKKLGWKLKWEKVK